MADGKQIIDLMKQYKIDMRSEDAALADAAREKYNYLFNFMKETMSAPKTPTSAAEADVMDTHQMLMDKENQEREDILSGKYQPKLDLSVPDVNNPAKMYDYNLIRDALDPPVGPQLPPRGLDTSGAADFSLHPESNKSDADAADLHAYLLAKEQKEREDTLAGRNLPQAATSTTAPYSEDVQEPLSINQENQSFDPSFLAGNKASKEEIANIVRALSKYKKSSPDYPAPDPDILKLIGGM